MSQITPISFKRKAEAPPEDLPNSKRPDDEKIAEIFQATALYTPLMSAVIQDSPMLVAKELNDPSLDPNLQEPVYGDTALMLGCFLGRGKIVSMLLTHKAVKKKIFTLKNKKEETALDMAVNASHFDMALLLASTKYEGNWTPFMQACDKNQLPLVETLLKIPGLDLHEVNDLGESALSRACTSNRVEIVDRLLKMPGGDLEINSQREWHGRTVLMTACHNSSIRLAARLLQVPTIDPSLIAPTTMFRNTTPLGIACDDKNYPLIQVLLQHSGVVQTIDQKVWGQTLLERTQDPQTIQMLKEALERETKKVQGIIYDAIQIIPSNLTPLITNYLYSC